jgi:hypothetical protein
MSLNSLAAYQLASLSLLLVILSLLLAKDLPRVSVAKNYPGFLAKKSRFLSFEAKMLAKNPVVSHSSSTRSGRSFGQNRASG